MFVFVFVVLFVFVSGDKSTDLQQILARMQGCCEDPNRLWDEEVQEKECPDVK